MRALASVATAALLALLGACANKNPYDAKDKGPPGPPAKVAGVDPDKFDCKAFLPESEVTSVAMLEVKWVPADMPGAPGTPNPCVYAQAADPLPDAGFKAWQFQLDCRPVGIPDATRTMDDLVKAADPMTKQVQIGRRGIDHTNARLITIDDDTDCAVYVVGPDETSRAALARLVLAKLNSDNLPRPPRAVK